MLLFEDHTDVVYSLAFSQDGTQLASGAKDGSLSVRDANGCSLPFGQDRGPNAPSVDALAFFPDGSLAVGHAHGWHLVRPDSEQWREIGPSRTPTTALAVLSPRILAVGAGDRGRGSPGKLELWDIADGRRLEPHFLEPHGVRSLSACPAKNLVAWVSAPRNVRVCDIRRQTPTDFPQSVACYAVALDAEARTLAVALDRPVRIYDLEKKRERLVLKGHTGRVEAVAMSPDGSTVATGSWDQTVRLWDATNGREKAHFHWQLGKVFSLAFAPDGQRLAAGTETGHVVVWDVE